jgi:hypothetical protein
LLLFYAYPIENEEYVNERRSAVGLEPIEEYGNRRAAIRHGSFIDVSIWCSQEVLRLKTFPLKTQEYKKR